MHHDPGSIRRARTRTLIQIGGMVHKAGLLEEFGLILGTDLQKDLDMKQPVSALMGALLEMRTYLKAEAFPHSLLSERGMKFLSEEESE